MFAKSLVLLIALTGLSNTGTNAQEGQIRGLGPRNGSKKRFGRNRPGSDLFEFANITCTEGVDEMTCDLPRGDEQGVFVCRSRGNRTGIPMCIPTDRSVEGDECGCCGGECPVACDACECPLPFSDKMGVYVLEADGTEPLCVPKRASARMIYKSDGMVTCYEGCL